MSRVTVLLLATVFCFYLTAASWSEPSGEKAESGISQGEKKWAAQWLTTRLPLLMEEGLIKRIKTSAKGESYEVYVASSW